MFKKCSYWKNACLLIGMILFLVNLISYAPVSRGLDLSTVSITNGMVKFTTIASYGDFLSQVTDNDLAKSIIKNLANTSRSSFQSLADSMEAAKTATDEFLLIHYLLNQDGMIIIGDWIIKVDIDNKRAGVLNIGNINYIDQLKNDNFYFDGIKWFTTEDEVLSLLTENPNTPGTLNLSQLVSKSYLSDLNMESNQTDQIDDTRGILPNNAIYDGGLDTYEWPFLAYSKNIEHENYKYHMKHGYYAFAVYFDLSLKIERTHPLIVLYNVPKIGFYVDWFYKNKKHGGEYHDINTFWYPTHGVVFIIYHGFRHLRKITMYTTFYYQAPDPRDNLVSYFHPMCGVIK
jgi:hypothetical protein